MAKILIVDDDSDMLDLVRRALAKDGHQIHTETARTEAFWPNAVSNTT